MDHGLQECAKVDKPSSRARKRRKLQLIARCEEVKNLVIFARGCHFVHIRTLCVAKVCYPYIKFYK